MEAVSWKLIEDADIDVLGHVNYVKYISFMENARKDWFDKIGMPYEYLRSEKRVSVVVLKLEIRYLKEALLGENLRIVTSSGRLGNKSFDFSQNIYNANGQLLVEATVTMVMFDLENRTSIPALSEIARHFSV